MTRRTWGILALALVLLTAITVSVQPAVHAQTPAPNTNPNVVISWPPPVYTLRGEIDVRGTVNLPNLANYFLEFRMLDAETFLPPNPDVPWLPASLPTTGTVLDDILATWDTMTVEDGLYELRLTANVSRQGPTHFLVSPLRVENTLPPFLTPDLILEASATPSIIIGQPTPTSGGIVIVRPTLASTPTSISNDPVVTANLDSNVRSGDDTAYPVVGSLPSGFSAPVLGIANTGSGWYYIELNNGRRGFISPTVVSISGNLANVPRIQPPPFPATATPTPLPATGDVIANGVGLVPVEPRCNETFEVQVNVTNAGAVTFGSGGTVQVRLQNVASGSITATGFGNFPALTPGQNHVVVIPLITNQNGGQDHRILVTADVNNNIVETNEGNNTFTSATFRLRNPDCS
jgi:uncharacterized protein YgiM (DUF1202 family)